MEKQGQNNRKKDIGSTMRHDRGSTEREIPVVQEVRAAPEPLDMNGYIRRLAQSISPALKKRIRLRQEIGDGALPVMANPARIFTIFAVLVACGSRLIPAGRMTVLTALVPFDAGPAVRATGNRCALLSLRAIGKRNQGTRDLSVLGRDRMLPALFNVRQIVGRDHGCFRVCVGENAIIFNVYLPIVRQSSVLGTVSQAVLGSEEEELWTSRSYERA